MIFVNTIFFIKDYHYSYYIQLFDHSQSTKIQLLLKIQIMGSDIKKSITSDSDTTISLSKFNLIEVIGHGGFGKVWKIETKKNKKPFALKQISKAKVLAKKSVSSVLNQRQLLQCLYHPFLINIVYAFQNKQNLYLVMDLVSGGDLRHHLVKQTKFNQQQTKFFIACTLIALEYLHNNGIIHRDVKPENIVFEKNGYLRLTDLGIAKIWKPQNSTDTSGTPGYMAPEVMCKNNHGVAADYFALGIIVYECMLGRRPYNGKDKPSIRDQILSKQVQIRKSEIPQGWSADAADFCNKLIQRKPVSRLGNGGPDQVKNHPWFKGYPWQKILRKEYPAPYLPHYNPEQFDEPPEGPVAESKILLRRNSIQNLFRQYEFDGVTVKNPIFEGGQTSKILKH